MAMLHGYCRHFGGHVWQSRRCHIKKGRGIENKCNSRKSGCPHAERWVPRVLNELRNILKPEESQPKREYVLGPYDGPPKDFLGEIKYYYWAGEPDPKGGVTLCGSCYAAHPAVTAMGLVEEEWILDTPTSTAGIAVSALTRLSMILICFTLTTALLADLVGDNIHKARRISPRRGRRDDIAIIV
jgi:hypothetical protein